jgi:hypothetical protein
MQIREVIGTTTHVDSSGEQLTREELRRFLELSTGRMMPVFNQHDHALPPAGRQVRSELRQLEDGEWGLVGIWQIWEPGDEHPGPDEEGREIAIREHPVGEMVASIDASLESPEHLQDVADIEKLGFRIRRERRKALDPGSVLVIAAGIGSLVAGGFLAEIGKDAWVGLRERIKSVRERDPAAAKRIVFSFSLHGDRTVEANVVLDNPTPEQIDRLFDEGFARIDRALEAVTRDGDAARVAFRGDDPDFSMLYTVDKHGFPSRIEPVDLEAMKAASINFAKDETPAKRTQLGGGK